MSNAKSVDASSVESGSGSGESSSGGSEGSTDLQEDTNNDNAWAYEPISNDLKQAAKLYAPFPPHGTTSTGGNLFRVR